MEKQEVIARAERLEARAKDAHNPGVGQFITDIRRDLETASPDVVAQLDHALTLEDGMLDRWEIGSRAADITERAAIAENPQAAGLAEHAENLKDVGDTKLALAWLDRANELLDK